MNVDVFVSLDSVFVHHQSPNIPLLFPEFQQLRHILILNASSPSIPHLFFLSLIIVVCLKVCAAR